MLLVGLSGSILVIRQMVDDRMGYATKSKG